MSVRPALAVYLLASAAGLFFSGYSTSDFVQHLDRQTHSIHCSFIPGLAAADASGASGCHAALMSPYSSVLRSVVWGGIPTTLAGMAVFTFLIYRAVRLILEDKQTDRERVRLLLLATLLPVFTSVVYAGIALTQLDELCKLCLGIYGSSFTAFGAAFMLLQQAAPADEPAEGLLLPAVGQLAGFVLTPLAIYVALVPDFSKYIGACGELEKPEDPSSVMVPIGGNTVGKPAIEVLDPLCPACSAFEERLKTSGLDKQLVRKAVLFPLDNACNWMVSTAVHPGACTMSEAVLCAGDKADAVLAWSFEHAEEVRAASTNDADAAKKMVTGAFPELSSCVGSAKARQRLNSSLRWAVANQLPVLTPQLYVNGQKLCDEDTDLGMDWALSRLLASQAAKGAR